MTELRQGWELARARAGAFADPNEVASASLEWVPAVVPGTVASAVRTDLDSPDDLEGSDWWYRLSFPMVEDGESGAQRLRFAGLATLAEVWVNGTRVLQSANMFRAFVVELPSLRPTGNELVIVFRALRHHLATKKPRPRWKTALVDHQNLRWVRATLLGHIPGWSPRLGPVGPWRPITLEAVPDVELSGFHVELGEERGTARIAVKAEVVTARTGNGVLRATLHVGHRSLPLTLALAPGATAISGKFDLPDVPLWYPHTHGKPSLEACAIEVVTEDGTKRVDCGLVGFRSVAVDRTGGAVRVKINGRNVFCRGACWTVDDVRSLDGTPEQLAQTLRVARDAGMNMIRVGGTMTYGTDAFYSACDALGILVWQDFMFANMDYPLDDAAFRGEVEAEVQGQLARFQTHACIAVYCGNSEIFQQAAMLGLARADYEHRFFTEALPATCSRLHPGVPYFPSSPCEGVLPFHTGVGLTHYYGVGAYRRPITDVRRSRVKFSPECLGFANVPEPDSMERMAEGALVVPHQPVWKAAVPRDAGAGWDFDDVRDHYLRELFGFDPTSLRSTDLGRYYELSRVVSGEMMRRVFGEWRRPASGCGGGLVWFLRDLRLGAGWGLLDSLGRPKSVYWYLRRAWAGQSVLLSDEGLDGLELTVLNEAGERLEGAVELELLHASRGRVAFVSVPVSVQPHRVFSIPADALLPAFSDVTYAYRFGPPRHHVVVARLLSAESQTLIHEDSYFPLGLSLPMQDAGSLVAEARIRGDSVEVVLTASRFIHAVSLSGAGFSPNDNYLNVSPGRPRTVTFTPVTDVRPFKAHISALNLDGTITVRT